MKHITGEDIKAIRLFGGLTHDEMKDVMRVKTRKTCMNWEKSIGTPNINQFIDLLNACHVDVLGYIRLVFKHGNQARFDHRRLEQLKKEES